MAGYFHEQVKHEGRPLPAASFDTMNMSEPVRDQQFNTSALEQGPHRPRTFETMNLDPPQRGPQTTKNNVQSSGKRIGPEAKKPSEGTPQQPKSVTESSQMTAKVVIVALSLRVCTALSLVIGLALIASFSKDTVETTLDTTLDTTLSVIVTVSFSYFASTKYALAVTILGLVYSIFEIVSMTIRLITGRLIFHTYLTLAIRHFFCFSASCVCVCFRERERVFFTDIAHVADVGRKRWSGGFEGFVLQLFGQFLEPDCCRCGYDIPGSRFPRRQLHNLHNLLSPKESVTLMPSKRAHRRTDG